LGCRTPRAAPQSGRFLIPRCVLLLRRSAPTMIVP
jgi:hypothetical protein